MRYRRLEDCFITSSGEAPEEADPGGLFKVLLEAVDQLRPTELSRSLSWRRIKKLAIRRMDDIGLHYSVMTDTFNRRRKLIDSNDTVTVNSEVPACDTVANSGVPSVDGVTRSEKPAGDSVAKSEEPLCDGNSKDSKADGRSLVCGDDSSPVDDAGSLVDSCKTSSLVDNCSSDVMTQLFLREMLTCEKQSTEVDNSAAQGCELESAMQLNEVGDKTDCQDIETGKPVSTDELVYEVKAEGENIEVLGGTYEMASEGTDQKQRTRKSHKRSRFGFRRRTHRDRERSRKRRSQSREAKAESAEINATSTEVKTISADVKNLTGNNMEAVGGDVGANVDIAKKKVKRVTAEEQFRQIGSDGVVCQYCKCPLRTRTQRVQHAKGECSKLPFGDNTSVDPSLVQLAHRPRRASDAGVMRLVERDVIPRRRHHSEPSRGSTIEMGQSELVDDVSKSQFGMTLRRSTTGSRRRSSRLVNVPNGVTLRNCFIKLSRVATDSETESVDLEQPEIFQRKSNSRQRRVKPKGKYNKRRASTAARMVSQLPMEMALPDVTAPPEVAQCVCDGCGEVVPDCSWLTAHIVTCPGRHSSNIAGDNLTEDELTDAFQTDGHLWTSMSSVNHGPAKAEAATTEEIGLLGLDGGVEGQTSFVTVQPSDSDATDTAGLLQLLQSAENSILYGNSAGNTETNGAQMQLASDNMVFPGLSFIPLFIHRLLTLYPLIFINYCFTH